VRRDVSVRIEVGEYRDAGRLHLTAHTSRLPPVAREHPRM
jgi:hypothetical protein